HDGRLDVIAAVDGERVVRAREEEVEAQRGDDGGRRSTPATPDNGGRQHHQHQDERRVRRPDLVPDGDENAGQREGTGDRERPRRGRPIDRVPLVHDWSVYAAEDYLRRALTRS